MGVYIHPGTFYGGTVHEENKEDLFCIGGFNDDFTPCRIRKHSRL